MNDASNLQKEAKGESKGLLTGGDQKLDAQQLLERMKHIG